MIARPVGAGRSHTTGHASASGRIDLRGIAVTDADVDIAGASEVTLTMGGSALSGSMAGAGCIEYYGAAARAPTCRHDAWPATLIGRLFFLSSSLILFWMVDGDGIIGATLQWIYDDDALSLKASPTLTWVMLIVYGIQLHRLHGTSCRSASSSSMPGCKQCRTKRSRPR